MRSAAIVDRSGEAGQTAKQAGPVGRERGDARSAAIAHTSLSIGGIMPMARRIGEWVGAEPIPEIPIVAGNVVRPTRKDMWPPEVWEEMGRIWRGEQE